jgi:hypothetical protein
MTKLATVDNPYYSPTHSEDLGNPRHVQVTVLRDWSITTLAAHGALDADQVAAAVRFRRAWETVQSIRPAAIGFDERIGNGRVPAGFAERQIEAATELRLARRELGADGYMLLGKICGEGEHIRDLYRTRRERDTATDNLRAHLSRLAAKRRT